jgi:HAD superfamily hydrolase (TIGR01509 family)
MKKAVIFDLDGVLIDSEIYFIEAEIKIFKKYGINLTKDIVAQQYLGLKLDDYLSAIENHFNTSFNHNEVATELHDTIEHLYKNEIPLVESARHLLESLDSYKLAVATSREKHLAQSIMARHSILNYFDAGVYREDVKLGKPNPEVFLRAAKALGVDPSECVVVEDARNGFRAGKAAGMFVIALKAQHNESQDFSEANVVIEDLSKIPQLIDEII